MAKLLKIAGVLWMVFGAAMVVYFELAEYGDHDFCGRGATPVIAVRFWNPRPNSVGVVAHRSRSDKGGLHTRRLYEIEEGDTEVRQERDRGRQGRQGIHERGTRRNEGARPRAEGGSAPRPAREEGRWGRCRALEDCRDAGAGSRHARAAPCHH